MPVLGAPFQEPGLYDPILKHSPRHRTSIFIGFNLSLLFFSHPTAKLVRANAFPVTFTAGCTLPKTYSSSLVFI